MSHNNPTQLYTFMAKHTSPLLNNPNQLNFELKRCWTPNLKNGDRYRIKMRLEVKKWSIGIVTQILNVLCGPLITFVHTINWDHHNQHKVVKGRNLIGESFKVTAATTIITKCLIKRIFSY